MFYWNITDRLRQASRRTTGNDPEKNGDKSKSLYNTAIRVNASAFGILAGLTGIIAGYFEIQQGDVIPQGLWISSIGPGYRMWEDSAYAAITVLPSFYLT